MRRRRARGHHGRMMKHPRRLSSAAALALAVALVPGGIGYADGARTPIAVPTVSAPIPGALPGDRLSPVLEDTYPFFSTPDDLARNGYVEQEFYLSGVADGWDQLGVQVATDVPYRTRIIVRRPAHRHAFNGAVLLPGQGGARRPAQRGRRLPAPRRRPHQPPRGPHLRRRTLTPAPLMIKAPTMSLERHGGSIDHGRWGWW